MRKHLLIAFCLITATSTLLASDRDDKKNKVLAVQSKITGTLKKRTAADDAYYLTVDDLPVRLDLSKNKDRFEFFAKGHQGARMYAVGELAISKDAENKPVVRLMADDFRPTGKDRDEKIQVEVAGKIATGILAIGGETTGIELTGHPITVELDCSRNKQQFELAGRYDGKQVKVAGELAVKRGVEIPLRWIVVPDSISPAKE